MIYLAQVPAGARCNFEDLRSSVGCMGWALFNGNSNLTLDKKPIVSLMSSDRASSNLRQKIKHVGVTEHLPSNQYIYRDRMYRPGFFLTFF